MTGLNKSAPDEAEDVGPDTLDAVAAALAGFDGQSLLALLYAACSSPTSRHRLPTMTVLWAACLSRFPAGTRIAMPDDLPGMADAAAAAAPQILLLEDWLPLDPAAGVVAFPSEDDPFPVHPGTLSDPLGAVAALEACGRAVRPADVAGFGPADILGIAARLMADQHSALSGHWAAGSEPDLDAPPSVRAAEVDSARRWLAGADAAAAARGDAGRRALVAGTADPAALCVRVGWPRHGLGAVLAVRHRERLLPVPAALVLSGAGELADRLLAAAVGQQRPGVRGGVDTRWRREADSLLGEALARLDVHAFGPVAVPRAGNGLSLVVTGHRHAVLIATVSALDPAVLARRVARARARLASITDERPLRLRLPTAVTDAEASAPAVVARAGMSWIPGLADALPFGPADDRGWRLLARGTVLRRVVLTYGPADSVVAIDPASPLGHVPVLPLGAFAAAAKDAASAGAASEVWAFVDELATFAAEGPAAPPVAFLAAELDDLWSLWRERGVLAPARRPAHAAVHAAPADPVPAWTAQGRRAPLDRTLLAAGLPVSSEWTYVTDSDMTTAASGRGWTAHGRDVASLSMRFPRTVAFVSALDRLVIVVPLDGGHLAFDRAAAAVLGDALMAGLQQVAHDERAWALWEHAHGDGTVLVHLHPYPAADPGSGRPAIWPEVCGPGEIGIGVDLAATAALGDGELHESVGSVLAEAVAVLLDPPEDCGGGPVPAVATPAAAAQAGAFRQAWNRIGPTVQRRAHDDPFGRRVLAPAAGRSEGSAARAERSVAVALAPRLQPGRHDVSLVRTVVCPAALDVLRDACAPFDPHALLEAACAEAERTAAERWHEQNEREAALSTTWGPDKRVGIASTADHDAGAAPAAARSAELLIEAVLRDPPAGQLVPDRLDIAWLIELARWPIGLALDAAGGSAGLQSVSLLVSRSGDIGVVPQAPPAVDVAAWRRADRDREIRAVLASPAPRHDPALDPPGPGGDNPFVSVRGELDRLSAGAGRESADARAMLAVDDALLATLGFGLDALWAVLDTLIVQSVPDDPVPPIAAIRRSDLIGDCTSWSSLPTAQIDAALARLTLSQDALRADDLRYWQLERRDVRLALRPVIAPPRGAIGRHGTVWALPRRAFATRAIFLRYLGDGRLPWPDASLPKPVTAALRKWRTRSEQALETETADALRAAGLIVAANVRDKTAARYGLTFAGEIDALAVDPGRRRVWVVECKHLREPFSPPEIAAHVADFHGGRALAPAPEELARLRGSHDAYVPKLLGRTAAVRASVPAALLTAFSAARAALPPSGGKWSVVPLIVTGHVEVAAFVGRPGVCFTTPDRLGELVAEPALPAPGWWPPSE